MTQWSSPQSSLGPPLTVQVKFLSTMHRHKHNAGSPHYFSLKTEVHFILSKVCTSAAHSFLCRMKWKRKLQDRTLNDLCGSRRQRPWMGTEKKGQILSLRSVSMRMLWQFFLVTPSCSFLQLHGWRLETSGPAVASSCIFTCFSAVPCFCSCGLCSVAVLQMCLSPWGYMKKTRTFALLITAGLVM